MAIHIGRRKFIATLGTVAVWPRAAQAQQGAMSVVGFINSALPQTLEQRVAAYRRRRFVESRNVPIEFRWAKDQYDRLPELTAHLVGRAVAVIAAGGPPAARGRGGGPTTANGFLFGCKKQKQGGKANVEENHDSGRCRYTVWRRDNSVHIRTGAGRKTYLYGCSRGDERRRDGR